MWLQHTGLDLWLRFHLTLCCRRSASRQKPHRSRESCGWRRLAAAFQGFMAGGRMGSHTAKPSKSAGFKSEFMKVSKAAHALKSVHADVSFSSALKLDLEEQTWPSCL